MFRVRLKSPKQDMFRRSVRDDKGNIIETMEFPRDVVVEINAKQLAAIKNDLGLALTLVDEKGKAISADVETTAKSATGSAVVDADAKTDIEHKGGSKGKGK